MGYCHGTPLLLGCPLRLDVRVPVSFSRGPISGRGITTSVASQSIRFEGAFDAPAGSTINLQLDLLGSTQRLDFRAKVTEVLPLPQRTEKLVTVGDFELSAEDERSYSAWIVERAPLVVRTSGESSSQAVRGALFEVSPDFSDVKVAWPTRASYARTFREELTRNVLRIRGSAAVPRVGSTTLVTMLIPQGVPTQVNATVVTAQRGDVEVRIAVDTEIALRLATYARG